MEITIVPGEHPGNQKVAISGALTIYQAAAAKQKLLEALDGAAALEVDLTTVDEMDTAGLQLLVLLKREAASRGTEMLVTGRSSAVTEVLAGYGLAAHFEGRR